MANTSTKLHTASKNIKSAYAPVNGLKLYYETRGAGRPLVLLHGGIGAGEMFDPILPEVAENRQVITVHLQGHGNIADIDRPLKYESMAEDIAGLMKHLDIHQADILGYSLGGGVALQTAIRHPDLVHKLVLISTPFKQHGFYPEVVDNWAQMGPEAAQFIDQSPFYQPYPEANWPVLFGKLGDLLRQDYDWSKEVAAIKAPVMIICADADAVRPAHALEFFARLGGGQRDAGLDGSGKPTARLAILPGMTHYDILTFPSLAAMVTAFLDMPM